MYAGSTFSCTLLQLQTMPPPMRFHLADWEGTMCGLTAQAHARSCACPLASCWWCLSVVLRQRRCRRLPVPIGCFNLGLETLVLDAPIDPVHLAYNPSYLACFFSRNNILLSQKISQQCFSAGL
jgi:hypothetical protein